MRQTKTWNKIHITRFSIQINTIYMTRSPLNLLLIVLSLMYSCDTETEKLFAEDDLVEIADFIIDNRETYSRFYEIMITGELKDPLNAYNPFGDGFTLFLPTDDAFDRFILKSEKYSSFNDLLNDINFVRDLGRYHLVNTEIATYEFPYGALPDTTVTGDFLTIGFSTSLDTTIYRVNNIAPVILANLEMLNGYVHVISELLEPVTFTGYDWLRDNGEYSILAGALGITGLKDTLGLFRRTTAGQLVRNKYTILAEHDSIYSRNGIHSLDDLIDKYDTPGIAHTDVNNGLYQFAAYHILERSYFLADFEKVANYNTYGNYPVGINPGIEIQINTGVDTFAFKYSENDTSAITYIRLYEQESNFLTKTGAIHFLYEIMEPYKDIPLSRRDFEFLNEPVIWANRFNIGTYEYTDQDDFEVIKWSGPDVLTHIKASASDQAWGDDYIIIEENFSIEYTMPKILPGIYTLWIRTHAYSSDNATIMASFDGKRIGANYNLIQGGTGNNPYAWFEVGIVDLAKYTEHTIKLESLIPGTLIWDVVRLVPE